MNLLHHPDRLKNPLIRRLGKFEPASWEEALYHSGYRLKRPNLRGKIAAFGGNTLDVLKKIIFYKS